MKAKTNLPRAFVGCVMIALLMCSGLLSRAQQNGNISWSARLHPDNSDYVEIFVDATNLQTKERVREANVEVAFYDAGNRIIEKENFRFLNEALSNITRRKFTRIFKHACPTAVSAQGVRFSAFGSGSGGDPKASVDFPLLFQASQSPWGSEAVEGLVDQWPPAVQRPAPDRLYFITSVSSGKVMDAKDGSQEDWTPLMQTTRQDGSAQQWRFEPLHGEDEGYYNIRSARSDKCVDVRLGDTGNSVPIILYPCAGGDGQKWRMVPAGDGGYFLQAKSSGKVIDVNGAAMDDADLIQYQRHGGKNQQWTVKETP